MLENQHEQQHYNHLPSSNIASKDYRTQEAFQLEMSNPNDVLNCSESMQRRKIGKQLSQEAQHKSHNFKRDTLAGLPNLNYIMNALGHQMIKL